MKPEHVGQSFSDFLDELGIREDVEAQAIKAILADRLRAAIARAGPHQDRHGGAHGHEPPRARSPARPR